jgi:hypothetical protein
LGPDGLKAELAQEIQKMLDAGHLRPGYVSHGHFDLPSHFQCGDDLGDYFHHPGDTILTLIQALPYLPESMQPQVKAYLQNEFNAYPPYQYNHIGWQNGAAREAFDLPPEVAGAFVGLPPQPGISGFVWGYNPYSLYALWQYAALQNDPALAQQLLASAQNNRALMGSLRNVPNNGTLAKMPFVHNAYIAGYLGYLGLEKLAGQPESSQMRQELDRLMQLRASQFSKDSAYATAFTRETGAYCRTLNVASNFMFLVPELADYLREHALTKVQEAVAEYEQIAPYWFVSLTEEGFGENALNPLYDSQALFLAKAWILGEDGARLEPYVDVPAFARGDLFYIQKLIVALKNYPTNPPVPSECNNIALGKLTNASGTSNGPGLGSPQVVDGDPTTLWNAGGFGPQWIEINLGTPSSIDSIRLHVAQFPQGDTTHEIWVADSSKVYTKLETVSGFTTDGEVLDRAYNPSLTSIQWVKVITTASPSWVAWYEIQVCQTTTPVSTPIPSACNNIALGKPTNGSEAYDVLGQVPSQAVDGSPTTLWNAGNFSPQWLEVDLGSPTSIGGIRLQVSQYPAGNTTHEIWVADSAWPLSNGSR